MSSLHPIIRITGHELGIQQNLSTAKCRELGFYEACFDFLALENLENVRKLRDSTQKKIQNRNLNITEISFVN